MAQIPLTRNDVSEEREAAIRAAVRMVAAAPGGARIGRKEDAPALAALLATPGVGEMIYTAPKPPSLANVEAFIVKHQEEQARGQGLLLITRDETAAAAGYHDIQLWPQWAARVLGGAIRPDWQGKGSGGAAAPAAFTWLFDEIGVDLICETAALDNIRTAKLLERIGFVFKGEIESDLPGGGGRASNYWELTRKDWAKTVQGFRKT